MINEFRKTLAKVIHLRSIIGYNGMVYALKRIPLIGKIIPDRLYRTTFLKVIYWILHIIKEVFKLFIGKIFGLGMIYLFAFMMKKSYMDFNMASGVQEPVLFADFALFFFLIYALSGIIINKPMFRCTPEKEYMVFMLRVNAAKLDNTLFIYDLAKLFAGYLIAGFFAVLFGAPFWICLGIPVLAVFVKLFGTGLQAFSLRMKNNRHKPMKNSTAGMLISLAAVMLALPFLFVIVINGYYVPFSVLLAVSALLILFGILGFMELKRFGSDLHRRALRDNIVREEVSMYRSPDTTKNFKKIKAKGTVKGDKKGFEYLNALFVKRHGKMLYTKPVVFTAVMLLLIGLVLFIFIYSYFRRFGAENCIAMVGNNLLNMILFGRYEDTLLPYDGSSAFAFFRWLVQYHMPAALILIEFADNSFKSTQAMFINCDNSLMTFSFFKQREKIIKLFDIRLKQLLKLNIGPVIACGLSANLMLFATGGQSYPGEYLVTFLVAFLLSVMTSVTWLSLYYLFQPFTTSVIAKGGAYRVTSIIIYSVAAIIVWVPLVSYILAPVLLVVTAVYIFVMRKLVYKHAPKSWRIKA